MIVDLRSDTVTKPTPAMYKAMAEAELGDNVLENDPTVRRLEDLAAELTGIEDALFVPSGTMSNQIALATHSRPGSSAIFENEAHMILYEGGGPAIFSGVITRGVPTPDGVLTPELIRKSILVRDHHSPGTSVICLENTHNRHGGTITTPEQHKAVWAVAQEKGIPVHLDGARLANAAAALGRPLKDFCEWVDTVSICLSKGLCSPVGSVLCGPKDFIQEAAFWRKRMGGGMRQAGILAACGIVSLTEMMGRLNEDHARAQSLAAAAGELPGLAPLPCPTNILILETERPSVDWQIALGEHGVRTIPFGPNRLRAVFHNDITDEGLAHAKAALGQAARALAS